MASHQVIALAIVAAIALCGCKKQMPEPDAAPPRAETKIEAGLKPLASAESVAREYRCGDMALLPFVAIEQNKLLPEKVKAGDQVLHKLVYAFCPGKDGAPASGVLLRRITHKGKTIATDETKNFTLTPGRFIVDVYYQIPPTAKPGLYTVEASFASEGGKRGQTAPVASFAVKETFTVEKEK
jgi:hypothetical protein